MVRSQHLRCLLYAIYRGEGGVSVMCVILGGAALVCLHSYTQYSGLIATSIFCLFLLFTDAHNTDTGLEHSTPKNLLPTIEHIMQFRSYYHPSLSCRHSLTAMCSQHNDSPSHDSPSFAIHWTYIMLFARLELTSLF